MASSMTTTVASISPVRTYDAIADLTVVSYDKLLRKDSAEAAVLLSACSEWGFFYLRIVDSAEEDGGEYLRTVHDLVDFSKGYFLRSLDEKMKDTRDEWSEFNICGYKPMALDTGNVEQKKDGCEGIRVPVNLVLSPEASPHLRWPGGVKDQKRSFEKFIQKSHGIATTILTSLSDSLDLKGEDRFEASHRPTKPSTSTAVLQHYPLKGLASNVSVGHFTHTDTGSITILFNTEWGLQVCSPDNNDSWWYIEPRAGHAIINVGDALKFLSGFRLKSSLHRVVPCPRRWTSEPRYATIFFLRPDDNAEFTDSEGVRWTGGAWLDRKFGNYRVPHSEQRLTAVATGRKGYVGLWDESKELPSNL